MFTRLAFLAAILIGALPGCATSPAAPPPFDPATMAIVADTTGPSPVSGASFFVLAAVDGGRIERNAENEMRRASFGRGRDMWVVDVARPVRAGKTRLTLRALIGHAAPIETIFDGAFRGGAREAQGTTEVELRPGGRYRVVGVIDELRAEVWLEDVETGRQLGTKIAAEPTAEGQRAASVPPRYACCNLHHDRDGWISDANYIEQPFVPAGTPLRVYEISGKRAKVAVNGRPMWLGLDYGRKGQTMEQFVARVTLADDPSARIAAWPADVQAAIHAGKVRIGMSREQATVALGAPRTDLTASPDQPRWNFKTLADEEFVLIWNGGQLQEVQASAEVREQVLYTP